MKDVRPPVAGEADDRLGEGADLAPFAHSGGASRRPARAVKQQTIDFFSGRALAQVPQARDPADVEALGKLRLHDRASAEGVAALQR